MLTLHRGEYHSSRHPLRRTRVPAYERKVVLRVGGSENSARGALNWRNIPITLRTRRRPSHLAPLLRHSHSEISCYFRYLIWTKLTFSSWNSA